MFSLSCPLRAAHFLKFEVRCLESLICVRTATSAGVTELTKETVSKLDNVTPVDSVLPCQHPAEAGVVDGCDFDDVGVFRRKSSWEILRASVILKLCSYQSFVCRTFTLMKYGQKFLGKRLFAACMKPTFYGHFVAGDEHRSIEKTVAKLRNMGIISMLYLSLEADVGEASSDAHYDNNLQRLMDCIELNREHSTSQVALTHLKISPLLDPRLLVELSNIIADVGKETVVQALINSLKTGRMVKISGLSYENAIPLTLALQRMDRLARKAADENVMILVDAEYTYMNPAIDALSLMLMSKYNQSQPVVWNTYQCYLKKTYANLCGDLALSEKLGFCFGVKLVRGAYMDQERAIAKKNGTPDPVHDTFAATNLSYQGAVAMMLNHVAKLAPRCKVIIASHNEESIKFTVKRMEELGIDRKSGLVYFGQIFGMCDHVSCALGQSGYLVTKSVPFGPVKDTLPYLSRRAMENQTIFPTSRIAKERLLYSQELKRRFGGRVTSAGHSPA